MEKEIKQPTPSADTGNLEKALDQIYERYGADLQAFFRDAYKEATLKCQEPHKKNRLRF
jgi:hypothetical protein